MRIKQILTVIGILFIVSCNKCKKDKCEESYHEIKDEFKSYCVFKPGSQWIYLDNQSNTYDTVKVEAYNTEVITSFRENEECIEQGTYRLVSVSGLKLANLVGTSYVGQWINGISQIHNMDNFPRFEYPNYIQMPHYDTLSIDSNTYFDAYVYQSLMLNYGDTIDTEVYVKNIGVVYRKFSNGQEFYLVDYHIE
jgi:hypothetical protein